MKTEFMYSPIYKYSCSDGTFTSLLFKSLEEALDIGSRSSFDCIGVKVVKVPEELVGSFEGMDCDKAADILDYIESLQNES